MQDLEALHPQAPRLVPHAALPCSRFLGGRDPHPRNHPAGSLRGAPRPAPGLPAARWREDPSWLLGIDLYHQGYLWEAHEQWEACFFASVEPVHRELVQALIQLAAALIQEHRGRPRGVTILVAAVRAKLGRVIDATPPGARLAGLDPRRLLDGVDAHFAAGAPPPLLEVG